MLDCTTYQVDKFRRGLDRPLDPQLLDRSMAHSLKMLGQQRGPQLLVIRPKHNLSQVIIRGILIFLHANSQVRAIPPRSRVEL